MRIWKFTLAVVDEQTVSIPFGAVLLDVQVQRGEVCLWALCDDTEPFYERCIAIYGTGKPMPDDPGKYIATFQMHGGDPVFHAFDKGQAR